MNTTTYFFSRNKKKHQYFSVEKKTALSGPMHDLTEAHLMSFLNLCFHRAIRKIFCGYPSYKIVSEAM